MQNTDIFIQKQVSLFYQKEAYKIAKECWALIQRLDKLGYVRKELYEEEREKKKKELRTFR